MGFWQRDIWEKLRVTTGCENDLVSGFAACEQCHKVLAFDIMFGPDAASSGVLCLDE